MTFKAHHLTIGPAFILFSLAVYLSFLTTQIDASESVLRSQIWYYSFVAFVMGINMAVCWLVYWGLLKKIVKNS